MTYDISSNTSPGPSDPLSAIFAALADPTRRSIFDDLMRAPSCVTDIARAKPVSRPAVSQHLKVLQSAGLVTVTQRGSHRIYAAQAEGLHELRAYLSNAWDECLQAYAAEITKRNQTR